MINITFTRPINADEFQELTGFVENQLTTDAYIDTEMDVFGDYASITLSFDSEGNITVL
mgnify:CR=1 FL=1